MDTRVPPAASSLGPCLVKVSLETESLDKSRIQDFTVRGLSSPCLTFDAKSHACEDQTFPQFYNLKWGLVDLGAMAHSGLPDAISATGLDESRRWVSLGVGTACMTESNCERKHRIHRHVVFTAAAAASKVTLG
ncbi:unnamed protein product [Calypogeia fissa]